MDDADAMAPQCLRALHVTRRRVARRVGRAPVEPLQLDRVEDALTTFERKFFEAEEPLYRLLVPSAGGVGRNA